MAVPLIEVWRDIKAIWPVETVSGTVGTDVWLTGKEKLTDSRPVAQVLEELAAGFGKDLEEISRQCAMLMQRPGPLPLPLQREFMLLPVTAELPGRKRSCVSGYLVQSRVVIYEASPDHRERTRVFFDDRSSLLCLQGVEGIRRMLTDAEILKKAFWGLYLVSGDPGDRLSEPSCGWCLWSTEGKRVVNLG